MKDGNVSKSEKTRELIISVTINLINESNGDVETITIRKVAEKANISVGLINHYFTSKDLLIEECVQRFIQGIVQSFRLPSSDKKDAIELATDAMKFVVDFLMKNEQISQVSILGDLKNPGENNNTIGTVRGIASYLGKGEVTQLQIKRAYSIVAIVQEAFLYRKVLKQLIGIDFYVKCQRDRYIEQVVRGIAEQIKD